MVQANKARASGISGSAEEARDEVARLEELHTEELPEENLKYALRTPKFTRMRFDWAPDDRMVVERARATVDGRITREFADVLYLLNDIYTIIRKQEVDEFGDPKFDHFNLPIWERGPDGRYIEDFTLMTRRQMEHFIGLITVRLFDWEQKAADLWADAMFAKAQFEERFAIAFDAPMSGTVDDRRAAGNKDAAEERYFAIYATYLSRRADAVVRSADRLSQRMKDLLTA